MVSEAPVKYVAWYSIETVFSKNIRFLNYDQRPQNPDWNDRKRKRQSSFISRVCIYSGGTDGKSSVAEWSVNDVAVANAQSTSPKTGHCSFVTLQMDIEALQSPYSETSRWKIKTGDIDISVGENCWIWAKRNILLPAGEKMFLLTLHHTWKCLKNYFTTAGSGFANRIPFIRSISCPSLIYTTALAASEWSKSCSWTQFTHPRERDRRGKGGVV